MHEKLCKKCGKLFIQDIKPDVTILHFEHPHGLTHLHLCTVCKQKLKEWLGIRKDD